MELRASETRGHLERGTHRSVLDLKKKQVVDSSPYMYIFTVLPQSETGVTVYIENRSEMYGLCCCDRVQEKGYNG